MREPDCSYENSDTLLNTKGQRATPVGHSCCPIPRWPATMLGMSFLKALFLFLRGILVSRAALAAENLALRQQLAVLKQSTPKPRLRWRDRFFWVALSKIWSGWRSALILVQPDTVIRWHRQLFRAFWRWKSRGPPGRPRVNAELRDLIRQMARENPLWGAPRIRSELRLLGYGVAQSTVAKYLPRNRKPPSQGWRTFLRNHVGCLASCDFFTVPTATFRVLYCFIILKHERRRVVHFNCCKRPSAAWVCQQLREAFPYDTAPRYLIRDRDGIYGREVGRCLWNMGIEEVVIAPRSPWQNPFVERLIGSIRRELLDHVIVLRERHLMHLLKSYQNYYHGVRCHQGLDGNAPEPRPVEPPSLGTVRSEPMVGGLHHRYSRAG